ncbi:unnamed protein product [Protopolystoma xenopodis]|uniref:Uncharacterized protein n=1 Tax=Protopolystoma xenopodis TaxID=117903 RepID=A0A448X8U2_9PLAT|nr:unnamed protein product [Protopolystoma xenopodis]
MLFCLPIRLFPCGPEWIVTSPIEDSKVCVASPPEVLPSASHFPKPDYNLTPVTVYDIAAIVYFAPWSMAICEMDPYTRPSHTHFKVAASSVPLLHSCVIE